MVQIGFGLNCCNMKKLLCLSFLLPYFVFAQTKLDFNLGHLTQTNFCDTLPIEFQKNNIFVKVKINGQQKRFMFDTGAITVISEEIQNLMQNPEMGMVNLSDVSNYKKSASTIQLKQIQLQSLIFEGIPAVVKDFKKLGFISCFDFDGIIGSNLLRHCIVHINIAQKIIILTDKIENLHLKNAPISTLTLDKQSNPYLKLNLDTKLQFDALFDSGASDFIGISKPVATKALKKGIGRVLNQGFGQGAIGLHGIGQSSQKNRVMFNNLMLGNYKILDFVIEVAPNDENAVGLKLCDYGTVTLDYLNKQFYFEGNQPTQAFKERTTLGFSFQPEETYYAIGTVWTGTLAEGKGLKSGFKLLKINDLDLSTRNTETDCILFRSAFLSKPSLNITYQDDKNQVFTITLYQE